MHIDIMLFLITSNVACGQLLTSDQVAREGDDHAVIPCDYSKVTSTPDTVDWNEVDEDGVIIRDGIVNERKMVSGRYSLRTMPGNAELIISNPVRNDSHRRFQCRIRTPSGDIKTANHSILIVYYLHEPTIDVTEQVVNEGDPVTLICRIPDGDPVPYVTWFKDGKPLRSKDTVTNSTMSVFYIKEVVLDDNGMYTCKAESDQFKGDDGKSSAGYYLVLHYITVTFTRESDAVICTADGYPSPSHITLKIQEEIVYEGETDTLRQTSPTCYAENGGLNVTKSLNMSDKSTEGLLAESFIKPTNSRAFTTRSNVGLSSTVFIVTTLTTTVLTFVPTFLISRHFHKRKEKQIHRFYQSKNLKQPRQPSIYAEINPIDVALEEDTNETVIANSSCSEVNSFYEDYIKKLH